MFEPSETRGRAHEARPSGAREPPFHPAAPPQLNLPKSGGAIRAIGETFKAGGPTGTGSMSVPLPISPGRDGIHPEIALAYDSGQGHSPLGIGWQTDVPSIVRRTDKGIPRYVDEEESDIFILSGQEDLVPILPSEADGWIRTSSTDGEYRVDAYRPRVEGLFARIERRTHLVTGDAHWRSISDDNVTSVFGLTAAARITDPKNPRHVFKWLLEATFDDRGHATLYEYKAEDLARVSASDPSETTRRREPPANTYLKRVLTETRRRSPRATPPRPSWSRFNGTSNSSSTTASTPPTCRRRSRPGPSVPIPLRPTGPASKSARIAFAVAC